MITFTDIYCFLLDIQKYYKCIKSIEIYNTENAVKIFPNVEYKIRLKKSILRKSSNRFSDSYLRHRRFLISNLTYPEHIDFSDFYSSGLAIIQLYEAILKRSPDITINIYYNGFNYSNCKETINNGYAINLWEFHDIVYKELSNIGEENIKMKYIEEIRLKFKNCKNLRDCLSILDNIYPCSIFLKVWLDFWRTRDRIGKIEKLIESRKNSYIISKLTTGELKNEDVKKYPELIEAIDELTKIKVLTGW